MHNVSSCTCTCNSDEKNIDRLIRILIWKNEAKHLKKHSNDFGQNVFFRFLFLKYLSIGILKLNPKLSVSRPFLIEIQGSQILCYMYVYVTKAQFSSFCLHFEINFPGLDLK